MHRVCWRWLVRTCFWVPLLCGASSTSFANAADKPALKVDSGFTGGSGLVEGIDQQRRTIRLSPTPHKERGWACWWYLRITGIEPGEVITLDVGDAPWATPDRAAFSTDNRHWAQTEPGQRSDRRIVYREKVNAREAWFAWGPPYLPSHAAGLIKQTKQIQPTSESFELCKSLDNRPVTALRLLPPKNNQAPERYGIWIIARQHAWESGSSWVCQGFVEWLISEDARASELRRKSEVVVVPIMDIDNVTIGAGGKEQSPHDHNRDWSDKPHFPAVVAAQQMIKQQDAAGRFDMFIDLHNPGSNDREPFFFVAPRDTLTDIGAASLDHFFQCTRLEMTGPLKFTGKTRESGPNYDLNLWRHIGKNWVARNTQPHVVSVTLETPWNTQHSMVDGYRQVGRELGLAIERYLRTSPRTANQAAQ